MSNPAVLRISISRNYLLSGKYREEKQQSPSTEDILMCAVGIILRCVPTLQNNANLLRTSYALSEVHMKCAEAIVRSAERHVRTTLTFA